MRLYWRLLKFLRPRLTYFLIATFCMAGFAATSGFSISMIAPFIKIILEQPQKNTLSADNDSDSKSKQGLVELLPKKVQSRIDSWLLGKSKFETLKNFLLLVVLIFLIRNVFWYLQSFLIVKVEQGVLMDMRNTLFSHFHLLPLEYFHSKKAGVLMSRITNDINLVRGAIANGLAQAVRQGLLFIAYLFLVFWSNWKLALLAMILLPIGILSITKISKKLRKSSALAQSKMGELSSTLQETISGIRVVKAFGMERFEEQKFKKQSKDYFKTMVKLTRLGSLGIPLTEMLGVLAAVAVIWAGVHQILSGQFPPEKFFLFLASALLLMQPLKILSVVNIDIQQGLAAAQRIFEVLDTEPKIKNAAQPLRISDPKNKISFQSVSFSYDGKKKVLENINLEVKIGEVTALVGPSGGGKSTLVDLLVRFYDPTEGIIEIDGVDIKKIETASLRNLMGIVTQETILFNDSIWNNIAYGQNGASQEQVIKAALAANAHQFIKEFPQGYNTLVGDRGVKLSGGQRQRIAIARALFKNPPILIFDEATSALDSQSEVLVQQAIENLLKNRTTFVIAHRLSTVQSADRIVVLDEGKIVQMGKHQDLIKSEGLYKKLYELQFRV